MLNLVEHVLNYKAGLGLGTLALLVLMDVCNVTLIKLLIPF